MTFSELRTEILDRLNLSSVEAQDRVGRAINRKYRLVTSAIGMQVSRRATVSETVTMGVSTLIFSNTEKVINVVDRSTTPYKELTEVTLDELRRSQPYAAGTSPTMYAIHSHTADTVTIEFNRNPQTEYDLYADVHQAVADLSGSNEPAFPESFHDVIIEGVLADELRKMEKPALAKIAHGEYERILSDLKMWIAKNAIEVYQGKTSQTSRFSGGGGGGSSSVNGASSYTQTGLITFDRDPDVPFAVTSGSGKVENLNADKLDGFDESAFGKLADNEAVTGVWTFNSGITAGGTAILWNVISNSDVGNQNNWAPGLNGNTLIRVSNASALTITGIAAGYNGQVIRILSNSTSKIEFAYNSGSSSVGNRLINYAQSANTPIISSSGNGYVDYQYDATAGFWRMTGHVQGAWITPTFAAGNFTAVAPLTWTVASGQVTSCKYLLVHNCLHFNLAIDGSTLGGAGSAEFRVGNGAWGGFSGIVQVSHPLAFVSDGAGAITIATQAQLNAGSTFFRILKSTLANWTTGTTSLYFSAAIEVA